MGDVKVQVQIHKQVGADFRRYLEQAVEQEFLEEKTDPGRLFMLRPSGFPYCGLRRWLDLGAHEDITTGYQSFSMQYYTRVGTTVHDVFQANLGHLGSIVGDWHCPVCKSTTEFKFYKKCKCGARPQYNELEVKRKKILVGHVDGLFYHRRTKTYWVIDYKTTSSRAAWNHISGAKKGKPIFPYKGNVFQIEAYVPLLEEQYGITVSGYMLVYLPRDNPLNKTEVVCIKSMSTKDKELELTKLDRYIRIHRFMLKAQTVEHGMKLVANKLCSTLKEYKELYAGDYEQCPYHLKCFDDKKIKPVIARIVKESTVYPLIEQAHSTLREKIGM